VQQAYTAAQYAKSAWPCKIATSKRRHKYTPRSKPEDHFVGRKSVANLHQYCCTCLSLDGIIITGSIVDVNEQNGPDNRQRQEIDRFDCFDRNRGRVSWRCSQHSVSAEFISGFSCSRFIVYQICLISFDLVSYNLCDDLMNQKKGHVFSFFAFEDGERV